MSLLLYLFLYFLISYIFLFFLLNYNGFYLNEIRRWQQIRDKQYTAIFESIDDFAYQTMIKKSLSLLLSDNSKLRISKDSWKLTDSSILYNYLLKNPKCEQIMNRVQLCKPFHCIGVLYVKGKGVSKYINANIPIIEMVASEYFREVLGLKETDLVRTAFNEISKQPELPRGMPVVPDYLKPRFKKINKKAIVATDEELEYNHRSHSAKLRVIERVYEDE